MFSCWADPFPVSSATAAASSACTSASAAATACSKEAGSGAEEALELELDEVEEALVAAAAVPTQAKLVV